MKRLALILTIFIIYTNQVFAKVFNVQVITKNPNGLFGVLMIFGLAAGIATNSALSLMLDLTLPEVAGTFVGVWVLAQALSRAMGKVFGGGLLDIGRSMSGPKIHLEHFLLFSF